MRFANGSALLNHFFIRLGFLQDWAAICPEPRRQEVFDALEARLNALAIEGDGLALSIPMLYLDAVKD